MIKRSTRAGVTSGIPAAPLPSRVARMSRPLLVILQALSPCGTTLTTLYCDHPHEADLAVEALTDEGWTFTREEVRA